MNRPRFVTLTLWGVISLGAWNGARALAVWQQRTVARAAGVTLDPNVRLGLALIWTALFLGAAAALWQKRPFTRRALPILLLLYTLVELSLLARFAPAPLNRQSWLIEAILFVAATLFSAWTLNRSAAQSYFTKERLANEDPALPGR